VNGSNIAHETLLAQYEVEQLFEALLCIPGSIPEAAIWICVDLILPSALII
jgi:hypothetical protein